MLTDEELKAIEERAAVRKRLHLGEAWVTDFDSLLSEVKRLRDLMRGQTFVSSPDWLSPWISVEERLPDKTGMNMSDSAILLFRDGSTGHGFYLFGAKEWSPDAGDPDEVTHWMPLPAPPNRRES